MIKKQSPTHIQNEPLRIAHFTLSNLDMMPLSEQHSFSAMKYGDPKSIALVANDVYKSLLNDDRFTVLVSQYKTVYLASSAYGSIPSPAHAVAEALRGLFQQAGVQIVPFKIVRNGGFERTNYGTLDERERQKVIETRKVSLEPGMSGRLEEQLVVIFDDLRSTGAHEQMLTDLMTLETKIAQLVFAYYVVFEKPIHASNEEVLNHALIKNPVDLFSLFSAGPDSPVINTRMLKFILMSDMSELPSYFENIGIVHCQRLYDAALTSDNYYKIPEFQKGFRQLEIFLMKQGVLHRLFSFEKQNFSEGRLAAWTISEDSAGNFRCTETGTNINSLIATYSRFKFGDVDAIQELAMELTEVMVRVLKTHNDFRQVFEQARDKREYINLTAPGVRNVLSSSNLLMREVGLRVNVWLSIQGLPTMSIRVLGRLGSGRDNYASLSAEDRGKREKTTQTIIPRSEYKEFPTHVIFLDDVEVSGQTEKRTRNKSLAAGALSFHSIFAFKVDPALARQDASIENRMNQFVVTGNLDETLAGILGNPNYQPVQRMLRLLLHPRNLNKLAQFVQSHISDTILKRIYVSAVSNDYYWIHSNHPGQLGEYGPSLEVLKYILAQRGLLGQDGILLFP